MQLSQSRQNSTAMRGLDFWGKIGRVIGVIEMVIQKEGCQNECSICEFCLAFNVNGRLK